jgi:glycosyltransferase involved in cell wall biosynthesis
MSEIISLTTIARNCERYIAASIESILAQTHADWRLEVWDDGSIDRSLEIARSYASRDRRIWTVPTPKLGLSRILIASNEGKDTPYLGWLNGTDLLGETALSELLDGFNLRSEVGLVYSQETLIDEIGEDLGISIDSLIDFHHNKLLSSFNCNQFRLIRRSAFEYSGGIRLGYEGAEEHDLLLRLSESSQVLQLKRPLYRRRVTAELPEYSTEQQASASIQAVKAALVRRGLDEQYSVESVHGNLFRLKLNTQRSAE